MPQDAARELVDSDYTAVSSALARSHGLSFSVQQVSAAIEATAQESAYHPIHDYLTGLKWDGVPRLEHWLHDFLGAEDSEYTAGVGRMFLVGMVARVMKPGCKMDCTLILEGNQGIRKSTACKVLAGNRYFSDNLPPIRDANKDLSQHLSGKWLIEMAEMSATSRADAEALKAFLTRTEETYRPAYGRNEITQPRQCVFIGTTNRSAYLRDATGDRRFWPVKCGVSGEPCDIEGLQEARDQIFAEAFHLYQREEKWWPSRDFEAEHIRPQQAERFECDPWEEMIAAHIETTQTDRLTVAGLLTNVIDKKAPARADSTRVKAILQRLGYVEKKSHGQRHYVKPE
ncbi:VapE domain-containing protein [Acetobacter persici]|uniref:VapE domain-containing protein n=1 Tax=Acetobacter persici TaxID=1076596 RepID=UPI0036D83CCF